MFVPEVSARPEHDHGSINLLAMFEQRFRLLCVHVGSTDSDVELPSMAQLLMSFLKNLHGELCSGSASFGMHVQIVRSACRFSFKRSSDAEVHTSLGFF